MGFFRLFFGKAARHDGDCVRLAIFRVDDPGVVVHIPSPAGLVCYSTCGGQQRRDAFVEFLPEQDLDHFFGGFFGDNLFLGDQVHGLRESAGCGTVIDASEERRSIVNPADEPDALDAQRLDKIVDINPLGFVHSKITKR